LVVVDPNELGDDLGELAQIGPLAIEPTQLDLPLNAAADIDVERVACRRAAADPDPLQPDVARVSLGTRAGAAAHVDLDPGQPDSLGAERVHQGESVPLGLAHGDVAELPARAGDDVAGDAVGLVLQADAVERPDGG